MAHMLPGPGFFSSTTFISKVGDIYYNGGSSAHPISSVQVEELEAEGKAIPIPGGHELALDHALCINGIGGVYDAPINDFQNPTTRTLIFTNKAVLCPASKLV
ncbi:hypothetical protein KBC03_01490 [Patescibacteria group bacterium]|nr:hypothetical protein [Patescibacteria group bacterium]